MGGDCEGGRPRPVSDVAALLVSIGPRWHEDIRRNSQLAKDAYGPLLASASREGIEVVRDLAYGPDPRHRLDVFRRTDATGAPVVAFVHGGAFVRGDKRTDDEIYDNVLRWFARRGFIGVNIEYRLAPAARHPSGAEDVRDALTWIRQRIGTFGGDAQQLLLIGHSAGGTHAASCVFDPAVACGSTEPSALVLISARLRADRLPWNPNAAGVAAYFGDDPGLDEALAPMRYAAFSDIPVFVVMAEFENPGLDIYALAFAHRLAIARGKAPPILQDSGHNHMSIVAHFDSGDDALGERIVGFFREVCPATAGAE